MALLDASAQETPVAARLFEPSDLLAYSAALARKAAMSMMKPEANQTSSVGMTEAMGSRMRRLTKNATSY
jgi:hypothetical protein